jgi:predicted RNase H-related nuclease YkuK (DUF458 family)
MKSEINFVDILAYLEKCDSRTKIYGGCDSERILSQGKFYADYTSVVVVHVNGNNGCKIFSETVRELDYDNQKKPYTRLMKEVYKVADLYQKTLLTIGDLNIEVHLDINPDEMHGSSCVISQAIGYIKGTCNVIPFVKPQAFAASYAADRLKGLRAA